MPLIDLPKHPGITRLRIDTNETPSLLAARNSDYHGQAKVELLAKQMVKAKFTDESCAEFLRGVMVWGRGQRNLSRALSENTPARLSETMKSAHDLIRRGRPGSAVAEVAQLNHVGWSFGSKAIRFLAPNGAVIHDSRIQGLGYEFSQHGYHRFIDGCQRVREQIAADEALPKSFGKSLRLCDVEGIVFQAARSR